MVRNSFSIQGVTEELADTFRRLVPLRPERTKSGKPPSEAELAKTSARALAEFYQVAREQREKNGLGIIARARVAFGLQQHLQAAGYPPKLVKQVLFSLLTSAFVGRSK